MSVLLGLIVACQFFLGRIRSRDWLERLFLHEASYRCCSRYWASCNRSLLVTVDLFGENGEIFVKRRKVNRVTTLLEERLNGENTILQLRTQIAPHITFLEISQGPHHVFQGQFQ
jgi:hypothetical protein